MQQAQVFNDRWLQRVALAILFICVALFAYTGQYLLLCVPLGLMFIALLGLNWKTAYWIFLFTIPASVEVDFFHDTLSTSVPDEPMMWGFLLLTIILIIRQPKMLPEWWLRNSLVFVVVLQYLWLLVAVFYSKEFLFSVKYLAAETWFLASFFVLPIFIFKEKRDFKKAFLLTLIPLLGTMLIIFYKHYQLHFSFNRIQVAVRGIYVNHVDYSTVMSMFFPLLCVALPLTKGKPIWIRLLLLGIIIFFLPAIYFTYARAAYLAIVFAGVVALAIRLKLVNVIMPTIYALMALLLVFLIHHNKYIDYRPNFERTYMHKNFEAHIVATLRGEDMSSMERVYRWIAGIRMSTDRPITGYGPHSFYYYYKPYAVTAFRTYVSRNTEHSTTHNYFLYMLVEQGWPAMLLYAILLIVFFAQAQKVYWRFKGRDRFYTYCTLGITMLFAAAFVNDFFSELIENHKVGSLFYLSIALLIILDKKSRDLVAAEEKTIETT